MHGDGDASCPRCHGGIKRSSQNRAHLGTLRLHLTRDGHCLYTAIRDGSASWSGAGEGAQDIELVTDAFESHWLDNIDFSRCFFAIRGRYGV